MTGGRIVRIYPRSITFETIQQIGGPSFPLRGEVEAEIRLSNGRLTSLTAELAPDEWRAIWDIAMRAAQRAVSEFQRSDMPCPSR